MTRYVLFVRAVDRGENPVRDHLNEEFMLEVEVPDKVAAIGRKVCEGVPGTSTVIALAALASDAIRAAMRHETPTGRAGQFLWPQGLS